MQLNYKLKYTNYLKIKNLNELNGYINITSLQNRTANELDITANELDIATIII